MVILDMNIVPEKYISLREAAYKIGISQRRLIGLYKSGKLTVNDNHGNKLQVCKYICGSYQFNPVLLAVWMATLNE